jgi:hypothetical protein
VDLEEGVAIAPTKDAQKLRRAAERKGKAEDQYRLALLHFHGREGLKQDRVAAAKWFRTAAVQEHAGAQCGIGVCYDRGEGVEQNLELAGTWLGKAAAHGNAQALGCLGWRYRIGRGVEQDYTQAVAWWKKGALGDDATSQYNLGVGYMHGTFGLPMNAHCAKICMMAAAKQGHAEAIEDLKLLHACAACGAPDASRACQGCRTATGLSTARYCSPACQAAHWKAHEPDCGPCQCHRCK